MLLGAAVGSFCVNHQDADRWLALHVHMESLDALLTNVLEIHALGVHDDFKGGIDQESLAQLCPDGVSRERFLASLDNFDAGSRGAGIGLALLFQADGLFDAPPDGVSDLPTSGSGNDSIFPTKTKGGKAPDAVTPEGMSSWEVRLADHGHGLTLLAHPVVGEREPSSEELILGHAFTVVEDA